MIYILDNANLIVLDFKNGGKITKLILAGHLVISNQQERFLSSGSYLMFPWVNRVIDYEHSHPYFDGKGLPIHGLCASEARQFKVIQQETKIIIIMGLQKQNKLVPAFTQTFTLQAGKLTICFQVEEKNKQIYCFGYHPYFQIDNIPLSDLQIETDIQVNLQLNEKMLPVYPFQKTIKKISSSNKYDHLFQGGSYFTLKSNKGECLKIQSNFGYWQIYTPDQKRIAVEPLSFCGNLYEIYKKDSNIKLPTKGNIKISFQS